MPALQISQFLITGRMKLAGKAVFTQAAILISPDQRSVPLHTVVRHGPNRPQVGRPTEGRLARLQSKKNAAGLKAYAGLRSCNLKNGRRNQSNGRESHLASTGYTIN